MVGDFKMKKFSTKIILAFATVACAGLVFSGAGLASPEKDGENKLVGMTGSYGTTLTKIISADTPMFSHRVHAVELDLDCNECHPDTFKKKRGAAEAAGDYTMKSLENGMYCGTCHNDDSAFGVTEPETCVTCHGSNIKQPKTIVFEKPKAVIFDHTKHTIDIGLGCDECHNDLFKMKIGDAESNPEQFTMEALYAGKYCGSCHDGENAFASKTKCTRCHIGVKGYYPLPDRSQKH